VITTDIPKNSPYANFTQKEWWAYACGVSIAKANEVPLGYIFWIGFDEGGVYWYMSRVNSHARYGQGPITP
jgi:hypothetical protein